MGTADRVLPWRRHAPPPDEELAPLLAAFRARHPKDSTALVQRAYELAAEAHVHQVRKSGEAYINHPLAVARIVADLGLDATTVAAALLHDVVEDTGVTTLDIEREFGDEVAMIVDGVTKVDRVHFDSKEAQQAATMRKMLVAMASDLRVLIIKLADRLHNLRTIAGLDPNKQRRTAQETLDIYAPLAHRLGMHDMKQQLEDLSFAALHPRRYAEIDNLVSSRTPERDVYLTSVIEEVRGRLSELKIAADVNGRPKHLYSIYEKMIVKGRAFDEIFDLVGIRVVVESMRDCYAALGTLHGMWPPVQGRFKDYIARPKFNHYQSLHTTVIGPSGKALEVQLRTRQMHLAAEYGVAAHWAYKERTAPSDLAWVGRILDWQQESQDPGLFMENLKIDLGQDEIYVLSPKGRVVVLPQQSTPIDFAYAIHTEVGHRCIGAKVNGRLVPVNSGLHSGDTCEIITSRVDNPRPSRDWLQFVVSPRARNKIRQWFSKSRREEAMANGQEELEKELRREGLPIRPTLESAAFKEVLQTISYTDLAALHVAIGEGHLSARSVAQRLSKALRDEGGEEQLSQPVFTQARRRRRHSERSALVYVEAHDDVMTYLANCCRPVVGDAIVGFVTRGRGVAVHRDDCNEAVANASRQGLRQVEVEWGEAPGAVYAVSVEVRGLHRQTLLRDVTRALAEQAVSINGCISHTDREQVMHMRFDCEVADVGHLATLLAHIRAIDGVYHAERVVPQRRRLATGAALTSSTAN